MPLYKFVKAPTVQRFLSTGSQTGWLFTISTTTTCAVGDTYTNNGNTYTVLGALTAQSGTVLFMSGSAATSGTSLVRSAGAGTTPVTFSTTLAIATYTPTAGVSYARCIIAGAGGSGGSNTSGGNAGNPSYFGANIVTANGGGAGASNSGNTPSGGTVTVNSPATVVVNVQGGDPQSGGAAPQQVGGGTGGVNPFGGGGAGSRGGSGTAGVSGHANTGAGGGAFQSSTNGAASGGGAGGYAEFYMTSLAASYPYAIGTGGTAVSSSGAGGTGVLLIEEYY